MYAVCECTKPLRNAEEQLGPSYALIVVKYMVAFLMRPYCDGGPCVIGEAAVLVIHPVPLGEDDVILLSSSRLV